MTRERSRDVRRFAARRAEVLVWGRPLDPKRAVQHRLSAAGVTPLRA